MQNPEDLVRPTQHQLGELVGEEEGPSQRDVEDLDVLPEELTDDAIAVPGGGEVVSHGGLGRRIFRVFVENKMAVVGV